MTDYQSPGGYQPQEGYPPPGGYLAGWWRRVGATILDGLMVGIPLVIVLGIAGIHGYAFSGVDDLVLVIYQILMLGGPRGQTVGNMAVSTRVVDVATGAPIGMGKSALRAVVELVLNISLIGGVVDVLWPLWDSRNQTLHDKAAGTVVIMA